MGLRGPQGALGVLMGYQGPQGTRKASGVLRRPQGASGANHNFTSLRVAIGLHITITFTSFITLDVVSM